LHSEHICSCVDRLWRGGVGSFPLVATRGRSRGADPILNKVVAPDEVPGATRRATVVVGGTV
jgi:hypothetical protein